MNIGIVTTWFERGAAYVSKQYRDILQAEHNVFIYARGERPRSKAEPAWNDTCVTWDKKPVLSSVHAVNRVCFEDWLSSNRIDLVLFNEQHQWEPVILCNRMRIKTGAYVDYYTKETVPLFGCYDFLICNTKRHYGVFKWHPQAFFVPWGTDIALFKPVSQSPVLAGFVTFFHSAGRSPDRKGTDLVLQAFDCLSGPARLVVHAQGPLRQHIPQSEELIRSLMQRGKLVLYEKTVPAPGLYHLGDVYVYPSRLEGIGLTIAEALACGLPVITSDNPPMNEFIDGTNGSLARISKTFLREDNYYWPQCLVDVEHLRRSMQGYVDRRDRLVEFRRAARAYAERHLDWSKNASGLPALFDRIQMRSPGEKSMAEQQARCFDKRMWSFPRRSLRLIKRSYRRLRRTTIGT